MSSRLPAAPGTVVDSVALLDRVRLRLAGDGAPPSPARVAAALRAEGGMLGDAEVLAVVGALRSEIAGAGPLEPLLAEPGVTDVLVNAPDAVWIDRGRGLERTAVRFADEGAVRRLAQRLAASAGRRLDDAVPFVDARLPGGVRLHAVLPPVAPEGTLVSMRVAPRTAFRLEDLLAVGSVSAPVAEALDAVVRNRRAFLVTGGTGTGKTTLLACLLGRVAPAERIVLVEEAAELAPAHPHVVRLEARRGNVEGAGEVALAELVRQALRMRPDRLVVGEVRGAEVVDLLRALNTGHEGGCGTVHANAAASLPARVEALGVAAGLSRAAVHSQLAAAVDVIVHLERGRDVVRRVAEVCILTRTPDGFVEARRALDGAGRRGPGAAELDRLLRGSVQVGP